MGNPVASAPMFTDTTGLPSAMQRGSPAHASPAGAVSGTARAGWVAQSLASAGSPFR